MPKKSKSGKLTKQAINEQRRRLSNQQSFTKPEKSTSPEFRRVMKQRPKDASVSSAAKGALRTFTAKQSEAMKSRGSLSASKVARNVGVESVKEGVRSRALKREQNAMKEAQKEVGKRLKRTNTKKKR